MHKVVHLSGMVLSGGDWTLELAKCMSTLHEWEFNIEYTSTTIEYKAYLQYVVTYTEVVAVLSSAQQ